MAKYVVVRNGNMPLTDGCNYLSAVDKDGVHFSQDVDDAIVFNDRERCILFARGLMSFQTVDVYRLTEKVVRSFEYVW